MKGVVILGEGALEVRDFADPAPGPDEVVLRMKASGICGTDLHHLHGPRRAQDAIFIEGHEPCGQVELVGSAVTAFKPGDRVMVHHYDGCRTCRYCQNGWTQLCPNAKVIFGGPNGHGGHADFMKVPAHTLVPMPDELSFKGGAAISCGFGTGFGAIKRVGLTGDETVAIFGQGPVGLSATWIAKQFGARVIALDVNDDRLASAKVYGADFVINSGREDAVAAIRALTNEGEGAHKAIECSGNETARLQALQSIRRFGTACMVGAYGNMPNFPINEVIQNRKNLVGSITFSKTQMKDCADYVVERGMDPGQLFTHEFRIDQAREAYDLFDQKKIGKGVFVFE